MKRIIYGGVRRSEGGFTFDYEVNVDTDIIDIVPPQLYNSRFKNKVYKFGYRFSDQVSSKDRTDLIHYIKGLTQPQITQDELKQFIERPLGELDRQVNLYDFDCFIFPLSGRSTLVQTMIETINEYTSRDTNRVGFETVKLYKNIPSNISFDWDMFEADIPAGTQRHHQMVEYVESTLLPAIQQLDYFSLAQNVKPKYRKYITNYLDMSDEDALKLSKFQGGKILIVDDINTSGATLNEVLRIVNRVNHNSEIFIYTLIGNF